jgi:signal transduction histidine kinase
LQTRKELDLKYGIAESYSDIGSIYLQQEKYDRALDYFFDSLKINEEIGNIPGIAGSYQAIGKCYSIIGENQKAIRYLERALATAKSTETLELTRDAAEVLSKTYAEQKQFSKAYPILVLFKKTSDALRNDQHVRKITQLEMKNEFDKQQKQQQLEQQKKDLEQAAKMRRQILLRWAFFAAFILVSLLAAAIFRSFRIKQKANRLLAKQQKKIEAQRDQLHELNVTKDKFFSIIGHDLRNPFSALIGLTKLLVTEFENFPKDQIKELLESIYKSSENTYNLLGNLLEWARSQTGKIQWNPEDVELNQVARSAVELLSRNAHQKNIRLQNEINGKTMVTVDKNMLHTVFRNLISNAIKFTPDEGVVTICSQETDNFIETRVSDTGVGIAEKDIEKLFRIDTHFSRSGTKDEQGTGLGLILCKEFLIKNGGNIWAESQEGKGSSFIFTLPTAGPVPQ